MNACRSTRKRERPAWQVATAASDDAIRNEEEDENEVLLISQVCVPRNSAWLAARRRVNIDVSCLSQSTYGLFRCFMACQPSVNHAVVRFICKAMGRNILKVSTVEVCFALKMSTMLHFQGHIEKSMRIYEGTGDLALWIASLRQVVPVKVMQQVVFDLFDNSGILYVFAILIRCGMLSDHVRAWSCPDQVHIVQDVVALQARMNKFVPAPDHDEVVAFVQNSFQF